MSGTHAQSLQQDRWVHDPQQFAHNSKRPTSCQFTSGAKMAGPPVVPVADLGDGRTALNSVSFHQQHATDQSTGHGAHWADVSQQGHAS